MMKRIELSRPWRYSLVGLKMESVKGQMAFNINSEKADRCFRIDRAFFLEDSDII